MKFKKFCEYVSKFTPKDRPSWQIDLKWIAAILATIIFASTLFLSNFLTVVSQDNVVDTLTSKVNDSVNQKIEEITTVSESISVKLAKDVKLNILSSAQENFNEKAVSTQKQIDELNVSQENSTNGFFSQKEKDKYLKKIELLLYQRAETSVEMVKNQESASTFSSNKDYFQLQLPKIYSPDLYFKFQIFYVIAIILFIIFFLAALYFSTGFGRLITAGLIFVISSIFGMKTLGIINWQVENSFLKNVSENNSGLIKAFFAPIYDVVHNQLSQLYTTHERWMIVGVIILVLGIIGKIIQHYYPKFLKCN